MSRGQQALVLWTKESKTGIEPLSHVPESARFVNAISTVQYSGDKKWYPAKVLMISDDLSALENKADEVSQRIEEEKDSRSLPKSKLRRKKGGSKAPSPSKASERDVAHALGQKVPTPLELQPARKEAAKAKKEALTCHSVGQKQLDSMVFARKNLFTPKTMEQTNEESDGHEGESDDHGSGTDVEGNNSDVPVETDKGSKSNKWCSCAACELLHKHCNADTRLFVKDLCALFDQSPLEQKQYLKLLPIPDSVKKVELSTGKGVYIVQADKETLKVDYRNKPSSLIRETLYALYGKDAFMNSKITVRGNKVGTYGIEDNVLKALWGFVNRNVEKKNNMLFKDLLSTINKRAPEWRKGYSSPASMSKPKTSKNSQSHRVKKTQQKSAQVTSTSPFKCKPLENFSSSRTVTEGANKNLPEAESPNAQKSSDPQQQQPVQQDQQQPLQQHQQHPLQQQQQQPLQQQPPLQQYQQQPLQQQHQQPLQHPPQQQQQWPWPQQWNSYQYGPNPTSFNSPPPYGPPSYSPSSYGPPSHGTPYGNPQYHSDHSADESNLTAL